MVRLLSTSFFIALEFAAGQSITIILNYGKISLYTLKNNGRNKFLV